MMVIGRWVERTGRKKGREKEIKFGIWTGSASISNKTSRLVDRNLSDLRLSYILAGLPVTCRSTAPFNHAPSGL